MKAPRAKHEQRSSQSMICVICLIGVLISAMSLGSLRLYGLYLEHRLAYVTMRIESVSNKNALLEERHSSLLSPSRIYQYAKSELNMITAREVETIRLGISAGSDTTRLAGLAPAGGASAEVRKPGILSYFTGTANAKD